MFRLPGTVPSRATPTIDGSLKRYKHTMMIFGNCRSVLYGILVLLGLALPTFSATAQTVRRWREPEKYDNGEQASVAVMSTGLVVEFHRNPPPNYGLARTIWYRIGKLSHGSIQWGPSHKMELRTTDVAWPQVAVTPQGQVIFTYSDWATSLHSDLIYWTGRIKPDGDTSQTIDWVQKNVNYDGGFHNNLALAPFYTYGVFTDVHEARGTGNGLYYRIGYLGGDMRINWITGSNGVKYESGMNPNIAINIDNQVVEVHQVTSEWLLHYRRGSISAEVPGLSGINFQQSHRYNNSAVRPAVAFIGRQTVVEMHGDRGLRFRIGTLSLKDRDVIDWTTPEVISVNDSSFTTPSVSSNGKEIVSVFERTGGAQLYFSVAEVE
jgi:hypothetical protein